MPKTELRIEVQEKSVSECYQACVSLVDTIGYKLFKKRDIANLIICNEKIDGKKINLTLNVPFCSPTTIMLNLSSENVNESDLQAEAERISDVLLSNLSAS